MGPFLSVYLGCFLESHPNFVFNIEIAVFFGI